MSIELWLTFVAASTALLLIPGPTVLLVLSYALTQGKRVALATAAGVALGDFVAMVASLVGLGAVVLASAMAFTALKWIGAVYLVWLGIKLLRARVERGLDDTLHATATTPREVFGHAFVVTALNPKSIAFFIAFVPQFIATDTALLPQFAVLVATFVTLAALNVLLYAVLADRMRARIRRPSVLRWLNRAGGGALIGMGAMTAGLQRAA